MGFGLQWGRNITVAECNTSGLAYMVTSPLQWGRNITVAECVMLFAMPESVSFCFNGAATSLLRSGLGPTPFELIIDRFNGAATSLLRSVH